MHTVLQQQRITISRLLIGISVVLGCFLLVNTAQAEVIRSFTSNITPHADGSFEVEEVIEYDFENADRHGIYRTIKTEHPQNASAWYKERIISVELQGVERDGHSEPYEVVSTHSPFEVKIGDPDQIISGPHTYTLRYEVSGGLITYDNGAVDLYWQTTGTEWPTTIEQVEATVYGDQLLAGQSACYQGDQQSNQTCSHISTTTDGVEFSAVSLLPGEGLTIAQALSPNLVTASSVEKIKWWLFIVPLILLSLISFGVWLYRFKTKYKLNQPIIPQYEPFADFKPMFTGVLIDGRLDSRDIAAGLIYLAQQGFISIKMTDQKFLWLFNTNDYEITLKKSLLEVKTNFLQTVLALLFSSAEVGDMVALSTLKTQSQQKKNFKVLQSLRRAIRIDLDEHGYFETPLLIRRRTRKGYEAKHHLLGFKDFLSTTEKERYKFHNAPAKNPEVFMEYLPYAIAFGVEKEWAEVFKDVTIPTPGWYEGNVGTFSAVALTNDLGAFSSSFSASSGTAASSGGGSVGGGVGGGGGGSW